jgi:flagellar biosynthesis protein FlhF
MQLAPGAYKFTVKSTAEAVALIREKLGPEARVLSVRAVEATGLRKLFCAPRLEVVAQVDPAPAIPPRPPLFDAISADPASPETSAGRAAAMPPGAARAPRRLSDPPAGTGLTHLLRRSGITETALSRM